MKNSTTPYIDGYEVAESLDVVCGEAIFGVNIIKDIFASVRDVMGGRCNSYEKQLVKARKIAIDEMNLAAKKLGADAVVGIDIDYESIGKNSILLMVSAAGTAVKIVKK